MRRAGIAATCGLGLALALSAAPGRAPDRFRVYLPAAVQLDRPALRPRSAEALVAALAVPGARVEPAPGVYRLRRPAYLAAGVRFDAGGFARVSGGRLELRTPVTITGQGLRIHDADGAAVLGVSIRGVSGDAVEAKGSAGVLLYGLDLSDAADGLFDLSGGARVTVRRSLFRDNVRGVLCGNWQAPADGREYLALYDVRFERVRVRTPKAQDCDVVAAGLVVLDAVEWPVDARGSSVVVLSGFEWSGRKINPPGWRADQGAQVEVIP